MHGLAQVVHNRFKPGLVQALSHHVSAADAEGLEGDVARTGDEFIEPRVFRRGAGHQQIVRVEPLHKVAKLGGAVQSNVGFVHHQADLQATTTSQLKKGRQASAVVICLVGVARFAGLGAGHTLHGRDQYLAGLGCFVLRIPQVFGNQPGFGGLAVQRVHGLRDQIDVRHKPQPQHIVGLADVFQNFGEYKGLA